MGYFKFKPGDVLIHKASGERVVVKQIEDQEERTTGGTMPTFYTQSARYICGGGLKESTLYFDKEETEFVFDLYQEK